MMRRAVSALSAATLLGLAGCAQNPVQPDAAKHIAAAPAAAPTAAGTPAPIPDPVAQSFALPRPKASAHTDTHSVVVHNVKVQDLLFALARDARINVDVHPGLEGTVTLNALDQTLPQLLARIAKQVDMRWEMQGNTLLVMPDSPFLRNYKIDYVNMNRDTTGAVSILSEIAATSSGAERNGGAGRTGGIGGSNNGSFSRVENQSQNRFWDTLIQNVKDLLRETDRVITEPANTVVIDESRPGAAQASRQMARGNAAVQQDKYQLDRCKKLYPDDADAMRNCYATATRRGAPDGDNDESLGQWPTQVVRFRESASVIANKEAGILAVRATARQHEKIQEFIDKVVNSARRQVLIEATIAEVELSDNYQQGIDWSKLNLSGTGLTIVQKAAGAITGPTSSLIEIGFTSSGGSFMGTVKLLDSFGTTKVLSSPKISALNNQTAVLKVVDNTVYFTINTTSSQNQTQTQITYDTELHSVPVGLVLNVTPQIADNDTVTLNVRPSLTRISGYANDPNPVLKPLGITNQVPIIRSREIDSVIRVENGNVAVMGGLMEDAIDLNKDTVPVVAGLPFVGALFQNRNDTRRKSELVILLRPTIVRQASLDGDYRNQRGNLPATDFFKGESGPSLLNLEQLPSPASAQ
ncbi:pilus (MSHA type) biogenesis protein MshL [Niveibacterium sp.]|uniref:pilus (MSHA type) biogenesis protein MshL n=1 Tax=Niveibacterium sp. TaxID=2017444 RepID=UPI0035B4DFC9